MLVYFYLLLCMITSILTQQNRGITYFTPNLIKDYGDSVDLECSVNNILHSTVSWNKKKLQKNNSALLVSSDQMKIVQDSRINVNYLENNRTFLLHISQVKEEDEGIYKCQINVGFNVIVSCANCQKISLIIAKK